MGIQRRPLWRGLSPHFAELGRTFDRCLLGASFQDFPEQRDLSFCRILPIELLSISPGCSARRRRCEKVANGIGKAGGRRLGQDASCLGCGDDVGNALETEPHAMLSKRTFGQPSWLETSKSRSAA